MTRATSGKSCTCTSFCLARSVPGFWATWLQASFQGADSIHYAVDRGIEWIRADLVLKDLFWALGTLTVKKTTHSIELTEWLLDHDPEKLNDVAALIRDAPGWKK